MYRKWLQKLVHDSWDDGSDSSFHLVRYFFGSAFVACDLAPFYAAIDQEGFFPNVLQVSYNFFLNGLRVVH